MMTQKKERNEAGSASEGFLLAHFIKM